MGYQGEYTHRMGRLENQEVNLDLGQGVGGGGEGAGWAAENMLSWKHSDQGDQDVVTEMSELKSPGGQPPCKDHPCDRAGGGGT